MSRACRAAVAWPGNFSLAFNISPVQLSCEDFPRRMGEELTLMRWNRNLERITGYTAGELLGFNPLNFFVEEEKPKIAEAIRGVFQTGSGAVEADYLLKDGTRIPYLFTGVRFENNGKQGFVGVGTDLSEHHEVEQNLHTKTAILDAVI